MLTKWTGELSSHVDIANFDDGTSLTSLIGKVVNVADDVDAIYLEKSKNLKTMASGNTVGARAIYSQPITLKNTATLIFTANEPPVFKDKSDGIGRRLLIIPFENKVKERIYNLDELLSTDNAKSYLLNLALKGAKRIYDNKLELSTSETITGATKQYYLDNDSVLAYLNDYPSINNNPVSSTYEAYEDYCEESNLKAISRAKFTRRLKSLGYDIEIKKMLGKTIRVITKVEV
jgi:putative DNA primase/helicase